MCVCASLGSQILTVLQSEADRRQFRVCVPVLVLWYKTDTETGSVATELDHGSEAVV